MKSLEQGGKTVFHLPADVSPSCPLVLAFPPSFSWLASAEEELSDAEAPEER